MLTCYKVKIVMPSGSIADLSTNSAILIDARVPNLYSPLDAGTENMSPSSIQ